MIPKKPTIYAAPHPMFDERASNDHAIVPREQAIVELHGDEKKQTIIQAISKLQEQPTMSTQTFSMKGKNVSFYEPQVTSLELLKFTRTFASAHKGVGLCQDIIYEETELVFTVLCLLKPQEQVRYECREWIKNPNSLPQKDRSKRIHAYHEMIQEKIPSSSADRMSYPYQTLIELQKKQLAGLEEALKSNCRRWNYEGWQITAKPGEASFDDENYGFSIKKTVIGHRVILFHKKFEENINQT